MKDSLLLFSNFLKNPKEVGAVAPSSKFLTKGVMKFIDFKNSKNIIELGPGCGTFTKAILRKARPDAKLLCFEVNKRFCGHMSKTIKDDRMHIINAGAEDIWDNLKKRGISEVDCIVSGLPFRAFPTAQKRKILQEVRNSLSKNGRCVLFQYTNGISGLLESYFDCVIRKFVPLNVPPSFVYVCWNR